MPKTKPTPQFVSAVEGSAVDLALVAVAAADSWARGAGLPPLRPYAAQRLLTACLRVRARHRIYVTEGHRATARKVFTVISDEINAHPPATRAAFLGATLMDLLNDRPEKEFLQVSDELTRIDRELPGAEGVAVEPLAAALADRVRTEFGAKAR